MTSAGTLQDYLEQRRTQIDGELDRLVPAANAYPPSIHRAMRHSVRDGKRLRPVLALEAARLFGQESEDVMRLACALEMIHTFSLIHDDLPALDNDELRRGKPTCHVVFGEDVAILAGDALAILAFEALATPSPKAGADGQHGVSASARLRVIREVSRALGSTDGLLAGQVVDLESTGSSADAKTLDFIHSRKTGALIRTSVRAGAIYAGASDPDLDRIGRYGENLGLVFQITDDLLDVLGTEEQVGKAVQKDAVHRKATYPALYGVEESRRTAARLVDDACEALAPYGERAARLAEIARFLITRKC